MRAIRHQRRRQFWWRTNWAARWSRRVCRDARESRVIELIIWPRNVYTEGWVRCRRRSGPLSASRVNGSAAAAAIHVHVPGARRLKIAVSSASKFRMQNPPPSERKTRGDVARGIKVSSHSDLWRKHSLNPHHTAGMTSLSRLHCIARANSVA